jgi:hypothetical protein
LRPPGVNRLQRTLRVHPLSSTAVLQWQGDCPGVKLRPGNVHRGDGWEELLLPEIDQENDSLAVSLAKRAELVQRAEEKACALKNRPLA